MRNKIGYNSGSSKKGTPEDVSTDDVPISGDVIEPSDDSLDESVDDIVEKESDELLAAEDKELEHAFVESKPVTRMDKIKQIFWRWWHNKKVRYATLAGLLVVIIAIFLIPTTRYFVLNNVGVRASATLTVHDQSTGQPLKNVKVNLSNQSATTGSEGKVTLHHLKLGRTKLVVQKRAFAEVSKTITVGWGSNPLADVDLRAVGSRYSFVIKDWLSDKPIDKAEASSGEFDTTSDKDGKLVLTVDGGKDQDLNVKITANNYRTETIVLGDNNKDSQEIKMVSGRKQAYISKRSGKYDLYKIDVDGKNDDLILAGTGSEQPEIGLVAHPTDEVLAMVSTRDNVRNKDGYLLSTLTLVDLSDNSNKIVTRSERVQVLGWSGDKLVFVQIIAGTSGGNPNRQKIYSYDYKTANKTELASSNYYNDLVMIGNDVYYAPSNSYLPTAPVGYIKIRVDGTNKQTLIDKEVWNIFRSDYGVLDLSVQQDWYKYEIGDSKLTKQAKAPASLNNRIYTDSSDRKQSLWVDDRDGKGTLLLYDVTTKTDKVIKIQSGLSNPVRWLDNHTIVYRVHILAETADYVLNIDGGDAKKIRDVTHTDSADRWYYY